MVVLAALNGESSLPEMWLWSVKPWASITEALGFSGRAHPPALTLEKDRGRLEQREMGDG